MTRRLSCGYCVWLRAATFSAPASSMSDVTRCAAATYPPSSGSARSVGPRHRRYLPDSVDVCVHPGVASLAPSQLPVRRPMVVVVARVSSIVDAAGWCYTRMSVCRSVGYVTGAGVR